MKQKLLYKYLIIIICACAWSGQAWGATGYVLAQDSSNDGEMWELTTSDPLALSGPGDKMIFEACKARTGVDGLYVEFSEDGNDWFDSGQGEIDVPANGRKSVGFLQYETVWKWKEFTIPINNLNVRYVRFRLKFGSTLNKYWRNVRVTRATTLGINTLPEDPVDFETVHRGSSRSKNVSVDYNNNSYNQDLTLSYKEGSTSSSIVTIPTTSMGETSYTGTGTSCTSTNPKIVSVTFSPTSTTALGSHSGTVTLSMNGATATFNTTANVVTTYYASSSVTAVPAAGGSAYTSFTTPNPTSGTTATKNSGDVSTANATTNVYFNAVANSNYVFKGWTAATATSYSGVTPVTSLTYKSENSSSPTSIAYKAWFAPLCNFSVTASVGNAGGGTAKVSVGNTILENASGTATANDVEGTPGTSSATQTFTFSATPDAGYVFIGWATSPSVTTAAGCESTSSSYQPTLTNDAPGSTIGKTLYAIFAPVFNFDATYSVNRPGGTVTAEVADATITGVPGATSASTTATFRATATAGSYVFKGWKTAVDAATYESQENPYTLMVTNSGTPGSKETKSLVAIFAPIYKFSASALLGSVAGGTAEASVAPSVEGAYNATQGTATATFTATTASDDYEFQGWSETADGAIVSTANPYTPTITNDGEPGSTKNLTLYAIFKLVHLHLNPSAPDYAAGTYDVVSLDRTLSAGYYTLALPFNTTIEALTGRTNANDWVAQLQTVTYNGEDGYTLYFQKTAKGDDAGGGTLSAGQPYVLHLGANITGYPSWEDQSVSSVVAQTVTATSGYGNNVGADGTYASWSMTSNFTAGMDMEGLYGIVNSGTNNQGGQGGLKLGGSGSTLNAFSAYITPPTAVSQGTHVLRVRVAYVDPDGTTTYIDSPMADNPSHGPVVIYGPDGKRRSRLQSGVNIVRQADGSVKKVMY